MRAVRIYAHGGVEQLRYEEVEKPKLQSGDDAVVRLCAAAASARDVRVRSGLDGTTVSLPQILGGDGAGIVAEVGARVKNVTVGDAVVLYPARGCGRCAPCAGDGDFMCGDIRMLGERDPGTYADYIRVPARNCFLVPSGFSFEEAAALPFVYTTLWRMLITNAQLKPGQWLLLRGCDDMAMAALQLGVALRAHVVFAGNDDDWLARAKAMGAEHAVDERAVDVVTAVRAVTAKRGVDVVMDSIGGDGWIESLASLAKGGRLVTCGAKAGAAPQTDVRRIFWNGLTICGSILGDRRDFREVLNFMIVAGMRPVIDRVLALKDAALAQQRLAEGQPLGRTVLRMEA